jgi:phosphohistidine phosphatase SixA
MRWLWKIACIVGLIPNTLIAQSQTVYLIRHAEKATTPTNDPILTAIGYARSARLPALFGKTLPAAVISSQFQRAIMTAQPVADAAGVPVTIISISKDDAASYPKMVLDKICSLPNGTTILVVGHSNSVPEMVSAWTGRPVLPIAETEYDRLFIIRLQDCVARDWTVEQY